MSIKMSDEEKREIQARYSYLVNYGDDPDEPMDPITYIDSNGDNLLHLASCKGDLRTVELLIKAGKDVNEKGDMGCTPLHYARMNGKADVADFLLKNGAQPGVKNDFGRIP